LALFIPFPGAIITRQSHMPQLRAELIGSREIPLSQAPQGGSPCCAQALPERILLCCVVSPSLLSVTLLLTQRYHFR